MRSSSPLGAGLSAEIDLVLSPGERIDASCFRLAKPEADLPWLSQGHFQIKGKSLYLVTDKPILDPILQIGIRVNCGHDLRRDYTLMLSPPLQRPAVADKSASRRPASPPVSTAPVHLGAGGPLADQSTRLIRAGETPASVAAELYPDDVQARRRFARAIVQSNRHLGLSPARGTYQPLPEGEVLTIPELPPAPPPMPAAPPRPAPARAAVEPPPPAIDAPLVARSAEAPGDRLVLATPGGGFIDAPLRMADALAGIPDDNPSGELELRRKLFRLEYRMLAVLENQAEMANLPPEQRLKVLQEALGVPEAPPQVTPPQVTPPVVQAPPVQAAPPAAKPVAQARPVPADEGLPWLWIALGLTVAGGLGWVGWQRWQDRRTYAHVDLDSPSHLIMEPKAEVDPFDEPPVSPRPPFRAPAPAAASMELDISLDDRVPEPSLAPTVPPVAAMAPRPEAGPESILDSSVDEVFSHNPVMELADIMLSFGRVKGAAQALQEYVDQNPKEALQPWVKLLEVYRMANMKEEFERLAKNLNENFNVELLSWDQVPKAGDPGSVDFILELTPMDSHDQPPAQPRAQSIEEMPHICQSIVERWGSSQCLDYIQGLLRDNRGGQRQGFPLAVVDELLFLSELLQSELFEAPLAPDIDLSL